MENIYSISTYHPQGRFYQVGNLVTGSGGGVIDRIVKTQLYFTGDPFDHYVGYDKDGNMLFSIGCLFPCDIVYIVNKD